MAYSANNVLVGAADLYLSVASSTSTTGWPTVVPAGVAGTSMRDTLAASANWRHVGYTTEGLELQYEPDYGDITVDQSLSSVKTFKQGITMMLNTTLAEATLSNLLVAWAQDDASYKAAGAATTGFTGWGDGVATADEDFGLDAGTLGDEPVERSLIAVGLAPRGAGNVKRERIYYVRRAISTQTSSFAIRRNEATVFPVSFRLLPDGSIPRAQFGTIRDRVIGTAGP